MDKKEIQFQMDKLNYKALKTKDEKKKRKIIDEQYRLSVELRKK